MIIILNNSIKYSFTHLTLIEIFYKFKIKKLLDLLNIENLKSNNFIIDNLINTFFDIVPPQASTPPIPIIILIIKQRVVIIRIPTKLIITFT